MAESLQMDRERLSDEERVRTLQRKLYQKAKRERKSKLYKQGAYEMLRKKHGLYDPWYGSKLPSRANA